MNPYIPGKSSVSTQSAMLPYTEKAHRLGTRGLVDGVGEFVYCSFPSQFGAGDDEVWGPGRLLYYAAPEANFTDLAFEGVSGAGSSSIRVKLGGTAVKRGELSDWELAVSNSTSGALTGYHHIIRDNQAGGASDSITIELYDQLQKEWNISDVPLLTLYKGFEIDSRGLGIGDLPTAGILRYEPVRNGFGWIQVTGRAAVVSSDATPTAGSSVQQSSAGRVQKTNTVSRARVGISLQNGDADRAVLTTLSMD